MSLDDARPRFATIANYEFSAVMRGRVVPIASVDDVLRVGLPWVPNNVCISALNTIPPDNPFGPMGETKIIALPHTRMVMPARQDRPAMAVYLCDITNHDRSFWEGCARSQLARTLALLEERHGLTLRVGFEHEFYIFDLNAEVFSAYSLAGARKASVIADEVQQTLATADARLDQFVPEFGYDQFETASAARDAMTACDHAVLAREAIRDAARARGARATFAPKPDLSAAGSGVHIHFSLWDRHGGARTAQSGALTATAGAFAAGILKHIEAVMAYSTPTPNSFQRATESSWVGVFACFGLRNREAALRLAPREAAADGSHPGASLEFRLCDGSANPYLAVATLVRAGMIGLDQSLDPPISVDRDPARIPQPERDARAIRRVPETLDPCLEAAAPFAPEWFGKTFWDAYSSVRRNDIKDAAAAGERYPALLSQII
ncbi:MAG: hypothetical protein AAGB11_14165 [Pseudomonadota bacterium]